jgi:hypothetical protein
VTDTVIVARCESCGARITIQHGTEPQTSRERPAPRVTSRLDESGLAPLGDPAVKIPGVG